jgi:hypothetical protein
MIAALAVMATTAAGWQHVRPSPFPHAASYVAHLRTTAKSKLCARCTFDGRHHYNSDPSKLYGHVAWYYGPTNRSTPFVNFLDVFLGARQQMFLVSGSAAGEASCTKVAPYPPPIFNKSWANGATYQGAHWFHERLCHHWSGVYPFFIQGEVYASEYYQDFVRRLQPRLRLSYVVRLRPFHLCLCA